MKEETRRHYALLCMCVAVVAFIFLINSRMLNAAISDIPNPVIIQPSKPIQKTIECETSKAKINPPAKKTTSQSGKTIIGHVSTYQAVKGQTDDSPCVGAMAGVNFCNPPYPIVANNGLPLGSRVKIRGVVYVVADRMNKRWGANYFDILTDGENYSLNNEPIEVL